MTRYEEACCSADRFVKNVLSVEKDEGYTPREESLMRNAYIQGWMDFPGVSDDFITFKPNQNEDD